MCGKKLSFPFLIIVIEAELLLQLGNKKWFEYFGSSAFAVDFLDDHK